MRFFHLYKKELLSFLGCFVLFLLITFFSCSILNKFYRDSYVKNNAILIHRILEVHPELEYELMNTFHHMDENVDTSFLNKYGFLNEDALSHYEFVANMEKKTTIILVISFLICFFLFLSLVLYFYLQREKRIREINHYLFQVLQNHYEVDLKDYQEDSLSLLKIDLMKVTNKLRSAMDLSVKGQKNLERTLSDISHQLRTPLTSLNVIHDALSSNTLKEEERLSFLKQQEEQLKRMEWLIVTLLKMSQIDSGTIVFHPKKVLLEEVITEAMKPSLILMDLKNIHYEVHVDSKLSWNLDFNWTVEALGNIFKNAMEHTSEFGTVSVYSLDNPLYVEIVIEDNGVGISKEDLPHIFERFYKGKVKNDSIGIGLNLTKTIIEKQSGTIHVESELGKGTHFIIHFYKTTI